MELDLSKLNNLAFVVVEGEKQAPEQPQKPQEAEGEYKTIINPQKPLQDDLEGIDGIRILQRKADQNKAERDHIKEVYRQHQENTIKSTQLQTEILKGVRAGESVYSLFLKASKAITLMTGNTAFYSQIEAEAKTIYGEGLLQKAPLQIELQETEQRLKRLREAQERELSGDSSQRMKNAIKAHEARIAELQELIEKGAENLG